MTSEALLRQMADEYDAGALLEMGSAGAAAIRDVLARLERAEGDSRRLDWVELNLNDFSSACSTRDGGVWLTVFGETTSGDRDYRHATLRDAIDAARKGGAK
jgi:hypothetical protein